MKRSKLRKLSIFGLVLAIVWIVLPVSKAFLQSQAESEKFDVQPEGGEETQVICLNSPVPSGWIVIDKQARAFTCGATANPPINVKIIEKYSNYGLDHVMDVCIDSPVPTGWILVARAKVGFRCGANATPPIDTIKDIRNIANAFVGTIVTVCMEAPIPTDWVLVDTSTYFIPCGPGGTKRIKRLNGPTPTPTPTPTPNQGQPTVGYIDAVDTVTRHATGWAVDPDETSAGLIIHFYIDAPAGNPPNFVGEATADIPRSDVNTVAGYPGNHAFSFPIPSQFFDGNNHTIYAYALDTSGNGNQNSLLINSPLTFNFGSEPQRTGSDYNGDGKADQVVFRVGTWHASLSPNYTYNPFQWGTTGDIPVPADYDGDGTTDYAIRRPNGNDGDWYVLQSSNNQSYAFPYGFSTDKAVPGDYDGDGKTNHAVFRGANAQGYWYILNPWGDIITQIQFGISTDTPVPADYDGDGRTDLAVTRLSNNQLTWYIQKSSTGFEAFQFGTTSDKPVPADYDGDGKDDIAVYRPSDGTWYLQRSTLGFTAAQFGAASDTPVSADYDGDGVADIGLFRIDNGLGYWFISRSTDSGVTIFQFGQENDIPVVGYQPPQ